MKAGITTTIALLLGVACIRASDEPLQLTGASMGTAYRVELAELPPGVEADALRANVARILRSIDERMSTYRPDSELSRFSASTTTDWFPVTEDTRAVVAAALRFSRLTDGAFDATVGPLVDLWGFGPAGAADTLPAEAELVAARASVGHALLETRTSPPALRKRVPGLGLDLSGLAKGFAVDAVARHLDEAGLRHYLIELGGELRARGRSASGAPWRVGIERPSGPGRSLQRVIPLTDRAVATSGDYRRFIEQGGRRLAHVIDPRTGRPAEHGIASATVLAETAIEADAFATALMVLAPAEGLELAEQLGLSAFLVVRSGDDLVELSSSGFERETLR